MKAKNNILLGLALTSAMLCGGQSLSQTEKVVKNSEKNLIETFESISHEKIITMKISDLISRYGREKTQEIIRKHAMIEINKYKQGDKYEYNDILGKVAQNHAHDMSNKNYFNHKNLEGKHVWDRVDGNNYNYKYLGENISNDDNIYDVIISYLKSKKGGHEEIFEGKYENIGIGISPILKLNTENQKYYFVFNFGKTF